jgi:hypothetical protein
VNKSCGDGGSNVNSASPAASTDPLGGLDAGGFVQWAVAALGGEAGPVPPPADHRGGDVATEPVDELLDGAPLPAGVREERGKGRAAAVGVEAEAAAVAAGGHGPSVPS